MPKHLLLAFTRPRPGREDEYNDWYSNHHLHDAVRLDGFRAGQRFRWSGHGPAPAWEYVTAWELEDIERAAASLARADADRKAAGNPKGRPLYLSDAVDDDRTTAWYTAITPRVEH